MINAKFSLLGFALASAVGVQAQFSPLVLTSDSYNQDVVIEKTALQPPAKATTATLDAGTNNTAFTYYEVGYNAASPSSGLPAPGAVFTSDLLPDHTYTFAANYAANNAILVDTAVSNATYTVTAPIAASSISLLAASGGGATTLTYTVTHANATTETGTIVVPDWFGGVGTALVLNGRVNAVSRGFANVDSGEPRLYAVDFPLTNTTSPVTKIDFQRASGGGHVGIFAISASTGGNFSNLAGTGFTYDMIVEAGAEQAPTGLNATTASVDAGLANTGFSWYEMGYNLNAPTTGIPAPGQTVTNAGATDHIYRLAPDYTVNDAILIDSSSTLATVTPATPRTGSGLSFLGSSGGGGVTISYLIHHTDSTTQEGTFVLPDWFNVTPFAFVVNGRANVVNADFSAVNGNNPRFYGIDVAVANTASPIASIDLNWVSGGGHAVIMAVSSSAGAVKPIINVQPNSVNGAEGSSVTISTEVSGTPPLSFRYQVGTNGNFVNLTDGPNVSGSTTTNLTLSNLSATTSTDYLLIAQNSAGSTTSRVARVSIISTKTDVTTPGDTVVIAGGTAPANEPVANAINDDTTKYLNFGTDGNTDAGFTGPVGLTVTLSGGSAVVTGLRIYTANDATERDPTSFLLEGSSDDGVTFTTVASGALSLPDERNDGGLALDPLTLRNQEVRFANSGGYSTYRLTFANVKNNTSANSLQLGEIELLGEFGVGAPALSVVYNPDGTITITSSQAGTLQSTTSLTPPVAWTNVGAITGSTTVSNTGGTRFFRVSVP